ncbi:dual specificity protein kinase Ttk isoform X2 [Nematostella vectensis]|uniref:dual specificity protein kinase Ttk isoform X2 n=1 Tax=Nematostella vectensis TaxID=45351 RepID=UPI0020777D54|nr:dual specificity protein kinase Ttk isoform X2 [Nematostella vectensis]
MTTSLPVFRFKHEPDTNSPKEWLNTIKAAKKESNDYKTLLRLYHRAAVLITPEEHEKDPAYAQLLVEFAQLQSKSSTDNARDTFRIAKCNVKRFAIVYVSWAQLELTEGNKTKCKKLLHKGKLIGAKPDELLQMAISNFEQGRERLLDEETEEIALTGIQVLPSTSLQPSTGVLSDNDTIERRDNTDSGIVVFKMPSVSEGSIRTRHRNSTSSSSSSSGEDTATAPFHIVCRETVKKQTMSHQKPSAKPTPEPNRTMGSSSLANSMNLSVRKPTSARRGLGRAWCSTGFLGLPTRAIGTLEEKDEDRNLGKNKDERHEEYSKGNENMDGIKPFELTVEIGAIQSTTTDEQNKPNTEQSVLLSERSPLSIEQNSNPCKEERGIYTEQNVLPNEPILPSKERKSSNELSRKDVIIKQDNMVDRVFEKENVVPSNEIPVALPRGPLREISNKPIPPFQESQKEKSNAVVEQCSVPEPVWVSKVPVAPVKGPPKGGVATHSPGFTKVETIAVNGKIYHKLEKIGRGGSSQVFRAFDGKRMLAVKQVSLEDADDVIIESYINEITLLNQLQGCDHIIKLYNWELNKEEKTILLVLEAGTMDLSTFLRKNRGCLSSTHLAVYWEQMLRAVNVIHERGIVHSDLKPANFLFVDVQLKLIDFGIANAIQGDQTSIQRDTQIGTLNFMAPEAFLDVSNAHHSHQRSGAKPCMKIGRASDLF